jgi:hypothetical protein
VSLPTFSPRSSFPQTVDLLARLSKIMEITEESRPTSIAASATNFLRPANPTSDGLRRSALLGGGSPSHSRASLESDPDQLPVPPVALEPGQKRLQVRPIQLCHHIPLDPRYTATPSYTATVTPSAFSGTNFNTWSNVTTQTRTGYTTPNPTSNAYSETDTFTRTSVTPPSGLRRPQTSPRSPLASVRNIVALWKEHTPAAAARLGEKLPVESVSSVFPPVDTGGLRGVRRRVEGARARLREARAVSNPPAMPTRLEGD